MVKIINNTIFNGIAGSRPAEKPKYYIMHNDAGSMSAESYVDWLQSRYDNGQSELGFAHYYITRDAIARVENTYNGTWSAANYDANMNSLSYEVCQQLSASDAEFIENENMVLRQMAEDMVILQIIATSSFITSFQAPHALLVLWSCTVAIMTACVTM